MAQSFSIFKGIEAIQSKPERNRLPSPGLSEAQPVHGGATPSGKLVLSVQNNLTLNILIQVESPSALLVEASHVR